MNETLQNLIKNYHSGLLLTPNIQVIGKKFSNETIHLPTGRWINHSFYFATFRNSDLIHMKFIHLSLDSTYFGKCLVENCLFEDCSFGNAVFEKCVFKNCRFIRGHITASTVMETIFDECTFSNTDLDNCIFESCHFLKSIFEKVCFGSAVVIDTKFSNSRKSIEFKEDLFFSDIFDQINQLRIDEE
uniref:Pentapeptide repeat-containing protein n=1 Tax=Amicula sp. isolate GU52X-4 cfCalB7 TaxID=3003489 RepID=A0A9E8YZ63_9STRA|nr:hypothetical protein [Amicula sp. isolate GU52X-4 cfCalB7]